MSSEKNRRRIFAVVALAIAGGALTFLALGGIGENLVYYWSPTELLNAGDDAVGASIRLGGLVAPGSIIYGDGLNLKFTVTDGEHEVKVSANAVPPAMFRESIGVVVEGTMTPEGNFHTNRLMVKHDNQYQAPEGDDERTVEELMTSLQFEESQ
jgi:cytochrome c-type biogenesis protein CcmE